MNATQTASPCRLLPFTVRYSHGTIGARTFADALDIAERQMAYGETPAISRNKDCTCK